ncbi:LptF/LptG family permease [Bacteroides sp. 51]|uniref:LptF/LptG family permease n=1 Tax=Bacteroides sp. 51 TaxID=2302938 RepID=UPI0013D53592|nr:LptF/LptG family permease [Bacteroides sp. 51]NDV84111.1 YjgP/YjgQ family permease [Bacteroides sp. 51]
MLRIKKLDIFILKSFGTLFIGTFFICLFIFMLQFLWRYVDELVGKGLEMSVLAQFFYYSALSLIPASMPLAILLAALITFGNFGERYELLAMKAAGISLLKIMRPLIVFVVILSCTSFFFQNVVGPQAQAKLYTLLWSMRQKSPELDIPEGAFYDEIDGYNLYVKKKDRKTGWLYDVTIYELSNGFENARIITADSGRLEMTADKQHLYLHLYSGHLFENLRSQNANDKNVPYRRESFREKHSLIDFNSDFNLMDASFMSNQSNSKNLRMLQASIDSMTVMNDSIGRRYYTDAKAGVFQNITGLSKEDTVKIETANMASYNVDSLFDRSTLAQKQKIITSAVNRTDNQKSDWNFKSLTIGSNDQNIRRHRTEWHQKFTLALSCLFFFFIGAPLGAIIRKGGLGMPVVISVLIFIVYYVINNMGYKMARDGKWIMFMGMWLSSAILGPLGAFLTYKSNRDSVVLNADAYIGWFKRVLGIRSVRNIARKDVIIHDPDYAALPKELDALVYECEAYIKTHQLTKAPNYYQLWMNEGVDQEMVQINDHLEGLVEQMSNTKSFKLLNALNNYPIIPVAAHSRPFNIHWLNVLFGALFPIGLFFYFRIWIFRIRLQKDLERVITTSKDIQVLLNDKID